MAFGKNKKLSKGGKRGSKKKAGDPFLKKEWYEIKAPSIFNKRSCGRTLVTKSVGNKIASDGLKGRVLELNLADLMKDSEDTAHKKVKLCIEEVQARNCLSDFHGMDLTRDKHQSLIRKKVTMIDARCDIKTTDGYLVRMFCLSFTKQSPNQTKTNSYAQSSQVRRIRRKMIEIMTSEASKVQLRELVKKLIPDNIAKEIEKQTQGIYPLKDTLIRKVKVLKKPKFDITKLMELHGADGDDEYGADMMHDEAAEAQNILSAEVAAEADES